MGQRTIRLNLDLSFVYGPRTWRAPLMAAMLLAGTGELNSESVTLSTYYPAPSGVYTNMITTGNTFLARDGGAVIVGGALGVGTATAPAQALDVTGNSAVSGDSTVGGIVTAGSRVVVTSGYVRVTSAGCVAANVTQGVVCSGVQYATFSPGFYVEGWSYQNRGGAVIVQSGPGLTSTQVRGLDPATGNEGWMTLKKDDSSARIYCCPK